MAGKASKLVSTFGTKSEGTLASKLGAALGEKAISETTDAEQKAMAAFNKLREQGTTVYKSDVATLAKTAAENPKLDIDDLVATFQKENTAPPQVSSLPSEPYKGVATPTPVTVGGKEYPSTFGVEPTVAESIPSTPESTSKIKKLAMPAAGVGVVGGALYPLTQEEEKNNVKEREPKPAPSLLGGTAQVEPPLDTIKEKEKGQEPGKVEDVQKSDIDKTVSEIKDLEKALGGGKKPSDKQLRTLLDKLEDIKVPEKTGDPNAERFLQQRAEAYRAYQRKADRNEWLDLAQSLVNSVTQFASAQAAMGTRFAGGQIPLAGVDYGARTARAAREYEMELGGIEAGERVSAKKAEQAYFNAKEKADADRSNLIAKIGVEKEALARAEKDADQARAETISLYKTILANRESAAKTNAALIKANNNLLVNVQKADINSINANISALENNIENMTNKLKVANTLGSSDNKNYEKNLVNYATLYGVSVDDIQKEADKKSGFFTADKIKNKAKEDATSTASLIREATAQLDLLRKAKVEKMGGTSPVAPSTPSTTPPQSDIVYMVDPDGRTLKVPAKDVARMESLGAKRK